ncbi:MAG: hypothetical protein AAGF11_25355 [Myxococcota bacterium]
MRNLFSKLFNVGVVAVLAGVLIAPAGALAETSAQGIAMADDAAAVVPMVKVEIKHRGRVLQTKPQRLDWDEASAIRLERGDRVHDVTLTVKRQSDQSKKLHVTLSYEIDGELVIEDFGYNTRARKREVLRTEGVALAVTITPRVLETDSVERENKLEPPTDSDDPLAGL